MANSLTRSQARITNRLGEGWPFSATVGSTAPFIGLFGPSSHLSRPDSRSARRFRRRSRPPAGPSRSADHDRTSPGRRGSAVLAYNGLIRRNKSITEDLAAFTNTSRYIMSAAR